jgi:tripartite-type tricarboxylate transporter receptor subunit TctC
VLGLIKSGQLRAIATAGSARIEDLPEVETVSETGFKNFDFEEYGRVIRDAKIQQEVRDRGSSEVGSRVARPMRARLHGLYGDPRSSRGQT